MNTFKKFLFGAILTSVTTFSYAQAINCYDGSAPDEIQQIQNLIQQTSKQKIGDQQRQESMYPIPTDIANALGGCFDSFGFNFSMSLPTIADIEEAIIKQILNAINKACQEARSSIDDELGAIRQGAYVDTGVPGVQKVGISSSTINGGSSSITGKINNNTLYQAPQPSFGL